jgi:riboflavin synthase
MFTGIVESLGTVRGILPGAKCLSLEIETTFAEKIVMGESIAVNGVCLTVSKFSGKIFFADVTPETLRRSSLANLHAGSFVNLERAMKADGRFGGHIVSGHIDGTGRLISFANEGNAVNVRISVEKKLGEFMVEKGSVAVDGISLTISGVEWSGNSCIFSAAVIPHTWQNTVLSKKHRGETVNIECDIVGKYIKHFVAL